MKMLSALRAGLAIVTGYPWGFVLLGVVMALTVAPALPKRAR